MPDPDPGLRPRQSGTPADELVLAALERASRHAAETVDAVPVWSILDHLALAPRSAAARGIRARLGSLRAAGWLERSRRHGVITWELTSAGRCRLRQARLAGEDLQLPESPQHRAWRQARDAAAQEIERFRTSLQERLDEAQALLGAQAAPRSDAWFELADSLRQACRRLGSASHCLYEWVEPDDLHADLDEHLDPTDDALEAGERARRRARRAGRRNVRLWDERPAA